MNSNKQFLGGNRNRIFIFWIGIVVMLSGGGAGIFYAVKLSGWQTTAITRSVDSTARCDQSSGRRSSPKFDRTVFYNVKNREYSNVFCVSKDNMASVVTYDPDNPADSLINVPQMYYVISGIVFFVGIITTLGALFASDKN